MTGTSWHQSHCRACEAEARHGRGLPPCWPQAPAAGLRARPRWLSRCLQPHCGSDMLSPGRWYSAGRHLKERRKKRCSLRCNVFHQSDFGPVIAVSKRSAYLAWFFHPWTSSHEVGHWSQRLAAPRSCCPAPLRQSCPETHGVPSSRLCVSPYRSHTGKGPGYNHTEATCTQTQLQSVCLFTTKCSTYYFSIIVLSLKLIFTINYQDFSKEKIDFNLKHAS